MDTVICAGEIDRAVDLLQRGQLVALPTETVYGLAADATSPEAVLKIFEAKDRPYFDPLIVHLPDPGWLDLVTRDRHSLMQKLAEKFWPGALTVVLPRREIIPDIVTSGLSTVAVRMSSHPVFRQICAAFGKPLAAPSANRFGRISPTCAQDVMAELGGRIPLIIDAGPADLGVESTIISLENGRIKVLRSGPVTSEELSEFAPVDFESPGEAPTVPGQLKSHYAPGTPMQLFKHAHDFVPVGHRRYGLLSWSYSAAVHPFAMIECLSPTQNLREAASRLFAAIRRLDGAGLDLIVAEEVPEVGLGIAIMDRLRKATANG